VIQVTPSARLKERRGKDEGEKIERRGLFILSNSSGCFALIAMIWNHSSASSSISHADATSAFLQITSL
jgi:hypothetical protein